MKFIIIGLGNFGTELAEYLTMQGHEVIGVDEDMKRVEELKEVVESTICLNSRDRQALLSLPIKEADAVFVTIGENFGTSIYTIALLKQLGVKWLVGRVLSPLHKTILEAIGVDDTVSPERDYAQLYATKVDIPESIGNYVFSNEYRVIEITVPPVLVGHRVVDIDFEQAYDLRLLSIKRAARSKGIFASSRTKDLIINDFDKDDGLELRKDDTLLLYGKINDLKSLINNK